MRHLALILLSSLPLFAQGDIETLILLSVPPASAPPSIPGPDSITGLKLWFKPESLSSSNNGDVVGRWTDSSGNNWDAIQGTDGNKPYYTNTALGSYGALYFDGTDDVFLVHSNARPSYNAASGLTAFAVHKTTKTNQNVQRLFWIETAANMVALYRGGTLSNGTNVFHVIGSRRLPTDSAQNKSAYGAINVWSVQANLWNPASSNVIVLTNGIQALDSAWQTAGNFESNNATVISIGGSSAFAGWYSELIFYNKLLDATERATVNTYLTNKYGVYPW